MQIRSNLGFPFTPVTMGNFFLITIDSGKNVGKEKYLFTVGGSKNWYSHYGNQCGDSSYCYDSS